MYKLQNHSSPTVMITSIYKPFWGTEQFLKSCDDQFYPVHNACKTNRFTGNGDVIRSIYEALLELQKHYIYAIYADGADSLVVSHFTPPNDKIIYSAEKAIWEPIPSLQAQWTKFYDDMFEGLPEIPVSPWRYLNGGGYCGPIKLLIEYFETYELDKLKGDILAQSTQAYAFLAAKEAGFPIYLDTECQYFQTTGFEHEGDFEIADGDFKNLITGTKPAILHGNGRTDMKHLYEYFNKTRYEQHQK